MRKLQRGAVAAALAAVGLDRVMQAGGQPIGRVSLACELQRSWACWDTVAAIPPSRCPVGQITGIQ